MTEADRLHAFVQLEFPWPLGPDDGRYLVRPASGEDPAAVLVLATLGAPERRLLTGRRGKEAPPEPPPTPVSTSRATVIDPSPLPGEDAAAAWLRDQRGDGAPERVAAALGHLNRALHGHRVAAADPFVHEVSADQALVVRLGYGRGEQVAEGRWSAAWELPRPRTPWRQRSAALRPQERLAALLAGRDAPLVCEELTLRARLDLDEGRPREAALELRVALEAALAELDPSAPGMGERVGELRERRGDVGAAANAALEGPLPEDLVVAVDETLERLAAALRARTAAGFG